MLPDGNPMTSTPQRLQGSERKRLIEDAASRLFAEQGYEGTSIEQIATAAGVTKPVVYLHFSSKQNLHLALLAKHRDELLGQLASDMRAPGALEYRIVDVATRWFAYVQSHPYAWQMLSTARCARAPARSSRRSSTPSKISPPTPPTSSFTPRSSAAR
jgi:AcrR family transcriptional regulator